MILIFQSLKKEILNKLDFYKLLKFILVEHKNEITIIKLKKQIKFYNNYLNPLFNDDSIFFKRKKKSFAFKVEKKFRNF